LFDKFYSEKVVVILMIFFLRSQYHIFMIYKQMIQFILTLKQFIHIILKTFYIVKILFI